MVTPLELIGSVNPWTGKPFGKEIKKGLQTRYLQEARRSRDIALGEIRKLVIAQSDSGKFSLDAAEEWREAIRLDTSEERGVSMVLSDRLEAAAARDVPEEKLRGFGRVAFGRGYPIGKALERYVEERGSNNRRGYKPLATTTVNNLRTAVKHLRAFLKDKNELACLEDITPALARRFRDEYLPSLTTTRSPQGMAYNTIAKNITLLSQFWAWALERGVTHRHYKSPWLFAQSVPRAARDGNPTRQDFSAEEIKALLAKAPTGTREGDVLRLALVTGCRADEIASLKQAQVDPQGRHFSLIVGKTANAVRFVPIPEGAQGLLRARLEANPESERAFPEWPVRASVGKVYALSQWFTRFRRDVLGDASDGTLALHSMRHTWRTVARRARVNEADINDLGGWAGPRSSNSAYDHGLLEEQLREAQEKVWTELARAGYLKAF
ncbi:hypothetical protein P775_15040 [Puniceibacterium antarcticum]|uniref:Tyr recombinase domain-containing protein n=2 Tax=Puniceibacterium antarcticum TaxID=1206336 RepID=A0A2G8RD81_9RHOB|nr:hypothetical protein P775_15040 [Puniceibacterium antarcticum]